MKRAAAVTAAACVGVWVLARWVVYDFFQLGDTRVYEHAARLIDAGATPYVDFDVEYPPLATGLFWLVGLIPGGDYQLAFSMTMLACLVATAWAALVIARRLGVGPRRTALAIAVIALTPLLLGTLVQTRYDLALAALLGWMVASALHDRFGWAWTLLALATAIKLVPILLVPALFVWHRHRRAQWNAAYGTVAMAVGVLVTFAPFAAFAPSATWRLFAYHLNRPPEVESLGSSILHFSGLDFRRVQSYGSDNVSGTWANALASLSTVLVVVTIAAIAIWFWRRLATPGDAGPALFTATIAASLVAAVLFGKVISPQYLVWLLPVVLLIPRRWGSIATAVMAVAMVVTQLVFPLLFSSLTERGAELPVWLLFARNLLLIVLLVATWPRRVRSRTEHTGPTEPIPTRPASGVT